MDSYLKQKSTASSSRSVEKSKYFTDSNEIETDSSKHVPESYVREKLHTNPSVVKTTNQNTQEISALPCNSQTTTSSLDERASSQDTEYYSIEASGDGDYDTKDFISSDEEGEAEENVDTKASASRRVNKRNDYSSSEEESERPWKTQGKEKGKYTLRQTTLKFSTVTTRNGLKNSKYGAENEQKEDSVPKKIKYNDIDTEEYRLGYPGKVDDPSKNANALFYKGDIKSQPNGDYIYKIHQKWFGKYSLLEKHHGYIQWLFPIRESGMNWESQPLQLHEAKAIQSDRESKLRVLTSYRLMLDFYGMKLVDDDTGEIKRSSNWKERFDNLAWSTHNYLRITRILKSLGELGYEYLKKPFLEFVIYEACITNTLIRLRRSLKDYWIGTIKDDSIREELYDLFHGKK